MISLAASSPSVVPLRINAEIGRSAQTSAQRQDLQSSFSAIIQGISDWMPEARRTGDGTKGIVATARFASSIRMSAVRRAVPSLLTPSQSPTPQKPVSTSEIEMTAENPPANKQPTANAESVDAETGWPENATVVYTAASTVAKDQLEVALPAIPIIEVAPKATEPSAVNLPASKNVSSKALPAGAASLPSHTTLHADKPVVQEHQPDLRMTPLDVVTIPIDTRPKAAESPGVDTAEEANVQVPTRSQNAASTLWPEAAVNIVILTENPATKVETPQPPVDSAPAVGTVPVPVSTQVTTIAPLPIPEMERKKTMNSSSSDMPDSTCASVLPPQTTIQTSFQPEKGVVDHATPREEPPHAAISVQEPPVEEKSSAQPLKSLALEFTPDGARDVRVRLAERSGEVHVSLHSSDPSTTKNLRDGVTDLAGVLAHAGYEAKTWTSGRQQHGHPQQREEKPMRRRSAVPREGTDSFDGILAAKSM